MRSGFRAVLAGLTVAVALALTATVATAQFTNPPNVDPSHYWSYHVVQPWIQPAPLMVQDQFFQAPVPVTVDRLERLLNWVVKDDGAVRDTFVHFTWWNIVEKLPVERDVVVTNQFGSWPVHVMNLEFLLAPAWKNLDQPGVPPAPLANHYLCYRAFGFQPQPLPHLLRDEWRMDQQIPLPMEYLCVPCMKEHQGIVYPIVDPVTHLAVYPIEPHSDLFVPFLRDQFHTAPHPVQQFPFEHLFVPSVKDEGPTPTRTSSWGRLKSLYR